MVYLVWSVEGPSIDSQRAHKPGFPPCIVQFVGCIQISKLYPFYVQFLILYLINIDSFF